MQNKLIYSDDLIRTEFDVDDEHNHVRTLTTYDPMPPVGWLKPGAVIDTQAISTFQTNKPTTVKERIEVKGQETVILSGCSIPVYLIKFTADSQIGDNNTHTDSEIKYSQELRASLYVKGITKTIGPSTSFEFSIETTSIGISLK